MSDSGEPDAIPGNGLVRQYEFQPEVRIARPVAVVRSTPSIWLRTGPSGARPWASVGARTAIASYETALAYAKQRKQFGMPLAAFQLIRYRLSRMLASRTPCSP
ncbi:acyl-CoA dehydrogenase family protein [Nonomuraea sp. NPDC049709]|uniref:acyl-CoA dehydrogenase family protein n=1 Tax=Nonomuraea sp. NPDC049709 TaxID=3154736 RepID=UPI0034315CC8